MGYSKWNFGPKNLWENPPEIIAQSYFHLYFHSAVFQVPGVYNPGSLDVGAHP